MSAATMNMVEQLRAENADLAEQLKQAEWAIAEGGASLKAALDREQALAAHVERMRELVNYAWKDGFDAEHSDQISYSYAVTVANSEEGGHTQSLAKRDLIKQAEGADIVAKEFEGEYGDYIAMIEQVAERLRQQAAAL